jgi:hypothetical protein
VPEHYCRKCHAGSVPDDSRPLYVTHDTTLDTEEASILRCYVIAAERFYVRFPAGIAGKDPNAIAPEKKLTHYVATEETGGACNKC